MSRSASARAAAAAARSPASQRYHRWRSSSAAARSGSTAGIDAGDGAPSDLDRRGVFADQDGRLGGPDKDVDPVARLGRVRDLLPELQRSQVVPVRIEPGIAALGVATGSDRGGQGPKLVARRIPVVGELGRGRDGPGAADAGCPVGRAGLERGREPGVIAGALAWEELAVDHLLEEGVPEGQVRVGRPAGRDQDPAVDDLAERLAHDGRAELRDRGEQVVIDPGPRRRGDAEDLLALLGDGRHPRQDHVAEPRRQLAVRRLPGGGEDLLGVERVPVGPGPDPVDEVRGRRDSQLVGQQARQFVAIESPEVDPVDPLGALELGDIGRHDVARVELVGPQGGDDQDAGIAQVPGQEREQVAGRRVGPLDVLDDQDQRRDPGEPLDDTEDELEQPPLGEPVVGPGSKRPETAVGGSASTRSGRGADLRHQPRQLASVRPEERRDRAGIDVAQQRPEGFDERRIRQPPGAEREAATDQDPGALGGHPFAEPLDEPRLPDPGLAGDEDHPRFAAGRARIDRGEAPRLDRPTDERVAAREIHDAAMIGAPTCTSSRPPLDKDDAQAHAVMPASSRRVRRRPRARHRRVRVAAPDLPMISAISSGR